MHYDIAIIGAGLVGASLALSLKDSGLRVALIDATMSNPADKRLFALNISSVNFLSHIGIWDSIAKEASPIHKVHVSRRKRFGVLTLTADDVNLPSLGFMMPARHLEAALFAALQTESAVDCYRPMQLIALQEHVDHVQLTLQQADGETKSIQAHYVIGADGTHSTVRQLMGWEVHTADAKETAIVTEMTTDQHHQQVAYERFYETGVLAMLPLKDQRLAVILTAPTSDATALLTLSDVDFMAHVQALIGNRLGKLQTVLPRASYPLATVLAKQAASKRVLLLGNAAHTVHPVAAQGFNLALFEVALFIDAMMNQLQKQNSLAGFDCAAIEAQFAMQQTISINASSRLSSMLRKPSLCADLSLQFGMGVLEMSGLLKQQFIHAMLGRFKAVPRLMAEKV